MSDREIKRMFDETDKKIAIDEQKRCKSIEYLMKKADENVEHTGIDIRKIIINQMIYMDKTMLFIQFLAEIIVMLIFLKFGRIGMSREDILAYTIIFSGVMGALAPCGIHKSLASKMAELGETCFFNTKQMVALQMVYSGIINLVLLIVGICFVGIKWQVGLLQIGLYILVPFFFSCCCCLGALLTEIGRRSQYTFVVVSMFAGVFFMVLASKPQIYKTSALSFWGVALVVGIFMFVMQIKILFHHIEKGEILCMN